ncbi:MAG: hypothetical protein JKY56_26870 [Kofleriaceae bacterium]|nr:hypothetical protein [Kofleriaceae bacterium]
MNSIITVLAHIKLKDGISEAALLAKSDKFQREFVDKQEGVLRRELVRKSAGKYIDIIQFQSQEHMEKVVELEQQSAICAEFFSLMDMDNDGEEAMQVYPSLTTYQS